MATLMMTRRFRRVLAITAFSLPIVMLLGLLSFAQLYVRCSDDKNRQFIDHLCTLYRNGAVAGGMCSKLCDQNSFRFEQCGNNRLGKQVIIMTCDDCHPQKKNINIVLKSQYDMPTWVNFLAQNGNLPDSLDDIVNYVSHRVVSNVWTTFGVDFSNYTSKEFMSFMWNQDFDWFVKQSGSLHLGKVAAMNILALGVQDEYLSLKILDNSKYLPHLYGTCGPAYFVEYTPSFTKLGYVLFQGKLPEVLTSQHEYADWNERAVAALKILKLVREFETSFLSPLHLCDLKSHNFAMNSLHDIALLDTDSVRFEHQMGRAGLPCTSDRDCDWMGCEVSCNLTANVCGSRRRNNNLQSICYHLFLSPVAKFGLLRDPPESIGEDLRRILDACAQPNKYNTDQTENKASWEALDQIETILLSSLSSTKSKE